MLWQNTLCLEHQINASQKIITQSLKENNHPEIWIQEMKIVDYLMIGATICIGWEILCLPYAGFFLLFWLKIGQILPNML